MATSDMWDDCVVSGDIEELMSLIEENGEEILEQKDIYEQSALHVAVQHGHVEMVDFLLDLCSSVIGINDWDERGRAAIHMACEWNNLEMVQVLVRHGCDLNVTAYRDEQTPLLIAAKLGYWEIAQFLVQEGHANVNAAESNSKRTTLQYAAQVSSRSTGTAPTLRLPMVQLLVRKGANANAKDGSGKTALHYACEQGVSDDDDVNLAIVQCLVEQGHANVEAVDENGQTPLFASVAATACNGLESSRKLVHYLVETCRANVNVVDNDGETPLFGACAAGCLETVQCLVEKGGAATVDNANEHGDTLLHVACRGNHVSIAQYLVERCHLNVETTNNNGETALHAALIVRSGSARPDVVHYLVQSCRANAKATNHDGTSALHMAMEYTSNTVSIIQCLVEIGHASVDAVDDDGNTALHVACRENRADMARYLLRHQSGSENSRASSTIETRNAAGHTPLLLAVRQEEASLDLVQCLVECDNGARQRRYVLADTSVVNDNGETALHYCCSSFSSDRPHSVAIAQYLASTSRVEQTDRQGHTALHMALDRLTANPTIVTAANGVGLILSLVKHLPADFGDETPDVADAAIDPSTDTGQRKRQKV